MGYLIIWRQWIVSVTLFYVLLMTYLATFTHLKGLRLAGAQAGQMAELHFTNLLTGRVALSGLPAGQYAYQLLVHWQLVAAPQKLLVNP